MSIQIARSLKIIPRLLAKFKLDNVYNIVSRRYQTYHRRQINRNPVTQRELTVFYNLYSSNTHPFIRERMYGNYAPLPWSEYRDSKLSHFLQYPGSVTRPYFIEPNDQILTLGVYFGAKTPFEIIRRLDDIKELIASENFKGLLIGEDALEDQFFYYFGSDLSHKLYKFPQMRCIPRREISDLKIKPDSKDLRFLFLASDYKLKAVELLIESWTHLYSVKNSTLTIACPNIPHDILNKISKVASINIIKDAPLSTKLKAMLLSNSNISLSLTHGDGGSNAFEGLEYGHPIITNSYHRSNYLVKNNNGVIIDFPNQFYRLGEYGYRFNSIEEYMKNVDVDIRQGRYDAAKQSLAVNIQNYIDHPELVYEQSVKSLQLAQEQSVTKSNERLLQIYREGLR